MRLLHTSDWHLGHTLFGRRRYEEFTAFLHWMLDLIEKESIEVLLIAGDIFDSSAPNNRVASLYYDFLYKVSQSSCRHIVITSGNHDSSLFLDAPSDILQRLNIHIIGSAKENIEEEVITLRDSNGKVELVVCAVPFLKDRDVRRVDIGESIQDKSSKLLDGIKQHYARVAEIGVRRKEEYTVPLVLMGHLFAAGGRSVEGDGMRELYVGTLVHVPVAIFSDKADYVALGHLHSAQIVGGKETVRYSGSPLPMSFSEIGREKQVILVTFDMSNEKDLPPSYHIMPLPVPIFQKIEQICGEFASLQERLETLVQEERSIWVEVIYQGAAILPNLRQSLEAIVEGSSVELLRIRDSRRTNVTLSPVEIGESLATLTPEEVFERCLYDNNVPEEQYTDLRGAFAEVMVALLEDEEGVN